MCIWGDGARSRARTLKCAARKREDLEKEEFCRWGSYLQNLYTYVPVFSSLLFVLLYNTILLSIHTFLYPTGLAEGIHGVIPDRFLRSLRGQTGGYNKLIQPKAIRLLPTSLRKPPPFASAKSHSPFAYVTYLTRR